MKRLFIISALFVYLFSSTELRELSRLPFLIEHFQEHSAGRDLSFMDFLSMHYIHVEDHGKEDPKDGSLPFKAHENCHAAFSQSPVLLISSISIHPAEFPVPPAAVPAEVFSLGSYSSSIWQPPKQV